MKIFNELGRQSPNAIFISLLLSVLTGLCYTLLIPVLMLALENFNIEDIIGGENVIFLGFKFAYPKIAFVFFVLCGVIFFFQSFSTVLLQRASIDLASTMRERLFNKIQNASISNLEEIGNSSLITSLTLDISRVVSGAQLIPMIIVSSTMIIGVLFYILFTNSGIFWAVFSGVFIAVVTYQGLILLSFSYYKKVREYYESMQESFKSLVFGAKELKINKVKSDDFRLEELSFNEKSLSSNFKIAESIHGFAETYGQILNYLIVGCVVFIFTNYYVASRADIIAIVMIVLFMSNPVNWILSSINPIVQANISYGKINFLYESFNEEPFSQDTHVADSWSAIQFKGVFYQYPKNGFKVGPIDLTLLKGEITFIVGGNGSGKSTFSKVASMHFLPTNGEIYFDSILLDGSNVNRYRQDVSAIFSDYYLFKKLYGLNLTPELITQANELLKRFSLESKVEIQDGIFSTLSLSDGQKRRLALVVALLEDKDLYLFDEWAADQDPEFRSMFYMNLLPELKSKNKAVLVITHDDRYFSCADQLLKFESGCLVENVNNRTSLSKLKHRN